MTGAGDEPRPAAVHLGARIGPYEVVDRIGVGGMGEVYRARDTRLGRSVAIKVLPAEFAADPDRLRRFEQEARAAAALNHPNILVLFDVGRHAGQPYLVTELLEGESLREQIARGGLTVAHSVELAIQTAKGLAAAHEKGIVHRDLKPGNVFVTKDGTVKILDFGLAKLTQPVSGEGEAVGGAGSGTDTASNLAVGTVGYMAPEQIRLQAVDHRADIFAFGCVLYEMLSGRRAFQGETPADTMSAILTKDPEPLSGVIQQLPAALDQIVRRCMAKRPEGRFQSATDLAHDLGAVLVDAETARRNADSAARRRWRTTGLGLAAAALLAGAGVLIFDVAPSGRGGQTVEPPRIIVLPFENLGAPEDAYFATGMADEISSRLANVQGLRVISRTTATHYSRGGKTVRQIGEDLEVDYVLEGSVRWERGPGQESRVRITPELIRVVDDTHVWANRYERVLADVFAIQSEVAESAVRAMGVRLFPRERTALQAVSTNDMEAYDFYLRGRQLESIWEEPGQIRKALQMYQAAVDRDARFAEALAGLAKAHGGMYGILDPDPQHVVKGREAAERAVALRPDLAEPHIALAQYLEGDQAMSELSAALAIQPDNSDALAGIGSRLRRQGRWAEAAEFHSRAVQLNPRSTFRLANLAGTYELAGRYADSDRTCQLALAVNPQLVWPYARRAVLQLSWRGDVDKAQLFVEEADRVANARGATGYSERLLRVALARRDYQGALERLQQHTRGASDDMMSYLPTTLLRGQVHRLAGQHDLALRSFEAARLDLEQRVREDPEHDRFHSSLGIAYAGLGRRDDAVREARRGCELMPASKDAFRALYRLEELALVYTMAGELDEAITTLDDLLNRSGLFTAQGLRLDPRWDPLRSDSRFQALLTKYEVRE